jgi:carbonic anhydrase
LPWLRRIAFALSLSLAGLAALAAPAMAQEVEWSYQGQTGPEHWATLSPAFATCGSGQRQSPIDIRGVVRRGAGRIRTHYRRTAVELENTGHTIDVEPERRQTLKLGGRRYRLLQLHFHSPSEHTLRGKRFALEIHFVHQADDGSRAVLGVLVRRGRRNRTFGRLLDAFPRGVDERAQLEGPINLRRLLPGSRQAFRYSGSLTTPPCTEGIRWLVLRRAIKFSAGQVAAYRELFFPTNRPVQPRNGRRIVLR